MTTESTDWGPNMVPPTPQDGTLKDSQKVANLPANLDSSPNDTPYDTQTLAGVGEFGTSNTADVDEEVDADAGTDDLREPAE